MMSSFKGKVAAVSGGTQGLGAAIAGLLAERGLTGLVTFGRNREKGEAVAADIGGKTGCDVRFVQADLASVDDCRKVIGKTDEFFGRVDILVNAAGVTDRGNILNTSEERFDSIFAVNVKAPFFLMQEAARIMVRDGIEGSMINIGSTSAMTGQPFLSAYSTSKGALATLTRNTAYALLRNRIRVNQLNIGWMATEGEDRIQREYHDADANWLDQAAASQPFGRLLDPNEVARAVAFLASGESGMMTGSVIVFDQSVWAGYSGNPPAPDGPMTLADAEV
jgi:NAD(P)-dependent dehydrogenase (short-subunit alcohol dehydrogenase family)